MCQEKKKRDEEYLGFQVHDMSRRMGHFLHQCAIDEGVDPVTASHSWLIGYLYHNQENDIFQKDLEKNLHMSKSAITSVLQNMEKAGYIKRSPVDYDARLKKVELTEEGVAFEMRIRGHIQKTEAKARENLTPEEVETLLRLVKKARANFVVPGCDE